ncbi:MAG: nuclear transport factor 2 family protein [Pseudomonadota bacterium]
MSDVADRIACQDVMLRYAKGVDERDLDLYQSCFAEDVEIVGFGDKVINGAGAWRDYVENALQAYGATQHMLGPQLATIDGDMAECRTDVQALHYLKAREGATLTLWATYLSTMRRIDGTWKISRHELVPRGTKIDPPE